MKILAIVPARGGSKGVPRKNIKNLAGKPLIAYTILEAKKSSLIDRIVVSTEDAEIAKVSKEWGGEVIDRPKELAEDSTKTEPVLQHALKYLKEKDNYDPDAVILLPATSPFRAFETINNAIDKFSKNSYDTLIGILPIYKYSYDIKNDDSLIPLYDERKNRQDGRKPVFLENGALYISKKELILKGKIFGKNIGYVFMDDVESINIDEELDFKIAENIIKNKYE